FQLARDAYRVEQSRGAKEWNKHKREAVKVVVWPRLDHQRLRQAFGHRDDLAMLLVPYRPDGDERILGNARHKLGGEERVRFPPRPLKARLHGPGVTASAGVDEIRHVPVVLLVRHQVGERYPLPLSTPARGLERAVSRAQVLYEIARVDALDERGVLFHIIAVVDAPVPLAPDLVH